jgi:serine/threonine protein phosphatase PrpC
MKFSISQSSRQGGRKYNQDRVAYSYSKEALLMVLADGMGGHFHGEVAAQISVQMVTELFQKHAKPALKDPLAFLNHALHSSHKAIASYADKHGLLESPRTTCVACVVQHNQATWAHVGDSRLYFFRGPQLVARTQDHSKVQQLFEQGRITEAEMLTHPERNKIYNCLGGVLPPEVELSRRMPIQTGDTILLCTDGVWGMLSESEIGAILDTYTITSAIPELLDHAEFRGGEEGDNLSAIGMTWGETQKHGLHEETVSTAAMPMEEISTQLDPFSVAHGSGSKPPVTEADIEKAIAEIQEAIKKYSK